MLVRNTWGKGGKVGAVAAVLAGRLNAFLLYDVRKECKFIFSI